MKALVRVSAGLLACCSAGAPALADNQHELTRKLEACYRAAAATYGTQTCNSPSTLVVPVHGKCANEETALYKSLFDEYTPKGAALARKIALAGIDEVHRGADPAIESWILDAQIKGGTCKSG